MKTTLSDDHVSTDKKKSQYEIYLCYVPSGFPDALRSACGAVDENPSFVLFLQSDVPGAGPLWTLFYE